MIKGLIFERPIVFLDFETTGVNIITDRIVQMACIKINPDGSREEKKTLIKPVNYKADGSISVIPIPKEASDIHGVLNEHVKDAPTFKQISKSFNTFLDGCDLGGYNSNRFDIPLLAEEFHRIGIDFDLSYRTYIDVMKLETVLNPRTLSAVYERYTGKPLDDAHDAMIDTSATVDIFLKQVETHELIGAMEDIDKLSQGENERVDLAGKLCKIDDQICWTFGKHKHKPITQDKGYLRWFLGTEVPQQTRDIINKNS